MKRSGYRHENRCGKLRRMRLAAVGKRGRHRPVLRSGFRGCMAQATASTSIKIAELCVKQMQRNFPMAGSSRLFKKSGVGARGVGAGICL